MLDAIVHDNRIQDEQLQGFVADRRLDYWVERCLQDVKADIHESAEAQAARLEAEREFQERLEGHGKANGHLNGNEGVQSEDDGDGDVSMG